MPSFHPSGRKRDVTSALCADAEGYVAQPGETIPDEHKEVSAVMIRFRPGNNRAGMEMNRAINLQGKELTLAWPIAQVMAEFFDKMGWVNRILELVAYLVLVVAAASILASIYNTMNERRREFAILRSLGARRHTVFSIIVLEAGTIAAGGAVVGYAVYAGILAGTAVLVRQETGVLLDLGHTHPALWLTPLGMLVLAEGRHHPGSVLCEPSGATTCGAGLRAAAVAREARGIE